MYNRVGLLTAKGSGTSGYIQKNRAFNKTIKNRNQFLWEMKKNQ